MKRDKQITFWATQEEKERLQAAADAADRRTDGQGNLSNFIRDAAHRRADEVLGDEK